MAKLWQFAYGEISAPDTDTTDFLELLDKSIDTRGLSKDNYRQVEKARNALVVTRDIINKEKRARTKKSYEIERKNFATEVELCYEKIKFAISNKKKARLLISQIQEKEKTPHSLLYILLYIISIKQRELGYGYANLFENDGGVPILERTNKWHADFELFGTYKYERTPYNKVLSSISLISEE